MLGTFELTALAARPAEREREMRKLRRLPWRIPKSHGPRHPDEVPAAAEPCARFEAERDVVETLPVAFSGGRYVPPVPRSTEIRRKSRHRIFGPIPAPASSAPLTSKLSASRPRAGIAARGFATRSHSAHHRGARDATAFFIGT